MIFHNKTILLLGERKSGKTTLLQYLLEKDNSGYLDDDNIFIFSNSVFGFCRPLPIRNIDICKRPSVIATTTDGDNCRRTLCKSVNNVVSLVNVDYVFFPRYLSDSSDINVCTQLQGSLFFDKILKNVRHSTSISNLYSDISYISKYAKGYYFEYSNSEEAYAKVIDILSEHDI